MKSGGIRGKPGQEENVRKKYEAFGLRLGEVDLFFHYQVERKSNILRLLCQTAKLGAFLLFVDTLYRELFVLPPCITEISRYSGFILYQKTGAPEGLSAPDTADITQSSS